MRGRRENDPQSPASFLCWRPAMPRLKVNRLRFVRDGFAAAWNITRSGFRSKVSNIMALPPELLLEIFGHLPPQELLDTVQNVCTTWRDLVRHPSLWENLVYYRPHCPSFEEVISFLETCPMLKHIHIHMCEIGESIGPEEFVSAVIENCSDIRTFCVEFLTDILTITQIDALVEAFPNLEFFRVYVRAQEAAKVVNKISQLKKLRKLIIESTQYCDCSFKPIVDGCVSLDFLDFDFPAVPSHECMYILENLKHRLKYLKFSLHQPVTQRAVNILGSFTKLEVLELRHCYECGPMNFLPLAGIKTLKHLVFASESCDIVEVDTFFDALFGDPLPLLQSLAIEIYCCDWGRATLKDICRCYPSLRSLTMVYGCFHDKHDTFEDICRMENLESFVYRESLSITDDDTEHIARCRRLKHLDLEDCIGLTDKTVANLTNCKTLESLNLSYCWAISGQNLQLIPKNLKKLRKLGVHRTSARKRDVKELRRKMPSLEINRL